MRDLSAATRRWEALTKKIPATNAGAKLQNKENTCGAQLAYRRCGFVLQKRYFEIVARRKKVSAISEYLLVSPADFCKDVNIFSKNVNISDKNANIFQQRKGKEKKEKKNIQNRPAKPQARKCAYGSFENVLLSDEELSKLQAKFSDWQERIEELSEGLESKGYKYKSHYATILAWDRREKGKKTSVEEPKAIPACWKED